MTSPIKSEDGFSAIMCLVTGQQFRYSHKLPHTCIIMEVHRKPALLHFEALIRNIDFLASASFVLNDNHPFPSHSYPQLKSMVPPDDMIACFIYRKHVGMIFFNGLKQSCMCKVCSQGSVSCVWKADVLLL